MRNGILLSYLLLGIGWILLGIGIFTHSQTLKYLALIGFTLQMVVNIRNAVVLFTRWRDVQKGT